MYFRGYLVCNQSVTRIYDKIVNMTNDKVKDGHTLKNMKEVKAIIDMWQRKTGLHKEFMVSEGIEVKNQTVEHLGVYNYKSVVETRRIGVRCVSTSRAIAEEKRARDPVSSFDPWDYNFEDIVVGYADHKSSQRIDGTSYTETCYICNGSPVNTCISCSGKGSIDCRSCNGTGEVVCNKCKGSGEQYCTPCAGTGFETVERRHTETVAGRDYQKTDLVHETCDSCYGSGYEVCSCDSGYEPCFTCSSSGEEACFTCSGSGQEICTVCDGDSYLLNYKTVEQVLSLEKEFFYQHAEAAKIRIPELYESYLGFGSNRDLESIVVDTSNIDDLKLTRVLDEIDKKISGISEKMLFKIFRNNFIKANDAKYLRKIGLFNSSYEFELIDFNYKGKRFSLIIDLSTADYYMDEKFESYVKAEYDDILSERDVKDKNTVIDQKKQKFFTTLIGVCVVLTFLITSRIHARFVPVAMIEAILIFILSKRIGKKKDYSYSRFKAVLWAYAISQCAIAFFMLSITYFY